MPKHLRALLVLVVVSSGAAGAVAEEAAPVPPYLRPETDLHKKYRARVIPNKVDHPALSFTPGGAKVDEASKYFELVVIEETADTVRIAADGPVVRVLYYVDPAAMPMVARKGAVLSATAAAATSGKPPTARTPGVHFRSGTEIEGVEQAKDGVARLAFEVASDKLTIAGFFPAAQVGRGFVPEKKWKSKPPKVAIATPIDVLDAPNGMKLATFAGTEGAEGLRLGGKKAGHVLIRYELDTDVVLVGWVKAAAVTALPRGMRAGPYGVGSDPTPHNFTIHRGSSHSPELKRGEVLYDAPDGTAVAVVLQTETHDPEADDTPGWGKYKLDGPYGKVTLFRRDPVRTR